MKVICLQHRLIEYLEKYNFLKIADANSIFADVKYIIQLLRRHFFAHVKQFELESLQQCRRDLCLERKKGFSIFFSMSEMHNSDVGESYRIEYMLREYKRKKKAMLISGS